MVELPLEEEATSTIILSLQQHRFNSLVVQLSFYSIAAVLQTRVVQTERYPRSSSGTCDDALAVVPSLLFWRSTIWGVL
jgi:hypothetical protein